MTAAQIRVPHIPGFGMWDSCASTTLLQSPNAERRSPFAALCPVPCTLYPAVSL